MSNIVTFAEFQYRRGNKELDKCRRIAQGMIERETSEVKKHCGTIALQGWIDAGNGRKEGEE